MNADFILNSIKASVYGSRAALVRELVLNDPRVTEARLARNGARYPRYFKDAPAFTEEHQAILDAGHAAQRRIDALLVKSGQRTAIEVKISRADYRRETPEKRRAWQEITHRFVYATPYGLIQPEEVPAECGLWWVYPTGGVVIAKKARVNKTPLPVPDQIFVALMFRAMHAKG